jgi:nucleoside-diphosphate-sugar epimerase
MVASSYGEWRVRVLVLGGTGFIGTAVLREIIRRGHDVVALARSERSAQKAGELGATPIAGDIASPERWTANLPPLDAVIHMACDFDSAMDEVERRLLDGLLPHLAAQPHRPRFITTGGCWLYGATGDDVATEATPFDPLPAFAWMVPHLQRVLATPGIDPVIIHPAMVYEPGGGVFRRFVSDAIERSAVRVVGSENVQWPLVHRDDLASLYALALEGGVTRTSYIGAAIDGFPVGRIARAMARRFGTRQQAPEIITADAVAAELGPWARGYARDQQLSGDKARRDLGWRPQHLDPESEIAAILSPPSSRA